MVRINPEWLNWSPDDFCDLPVHDLLISAGKFGREYRQLWTALYTQNATIEPEDLNLMERLNHAYTVAIRVQAADVLQALNEYDVPVENLDQCALLAASLYESRVRWRANNG